MPPIEGEARSEVELTGAQRAAILVMYLDRDTARGLLEAMDDDDIRAIGLAMGGIEKVESQIIESVVATFVRDLHAVSIMPRSGPEYVSEILPQLLDSARSGHLLPVINRRVSRDFEEFIAMRPPANVAAILRDEHPQTQAVALCLMGPSNAAKVLRHLSADDKSRITMRMARLKKVPGELADDVASAIREALGRQEDHLEVGGIDRTARMLGKLPAKDNSNILDELSDEDIDLADALRRRMVLFEDLGQLTNMSVQVLLKHIERDDLLVALKGASSQVLNLFLSNVSSRAADDIREELDIMGQISKQRIRASQERIATAALKLADDGAIYLPIGDVEDEGL